MCDINNQNVRRMRGTHEELEKVKLQKLDKYCTHSEILKIKIKKWTSVFSFQGLQEKNQ